MKKNYDSKVKEPALEIGQVVGLVLTAAEKKKYPLHLSSSNIPVRIYHKSIHKNSNQVRYKVRTETCKITTVFTAERLFALNGGNESYPSQYEWPIDVGSLRLIDSVSVQKYLLSLKPQNQLKYTRSGSEYKVISSNEDHVVLKQTDTLTGVIETFSDNHCAVCSEVMHELQWHRCYICKKRMHNAIICPKKELIIQDDDILYCSTLCKFGKESIPAPSLSNNGTSRSRKRKFDGEDSNNKSKAIILEERRLNNNSSKFIVQFTLTGQTYRMNESFLLKYYPEALEEWKRENPKK
jgi:hypothetical protein